MQTITVPRSGIDIVRAFQVSSYHSVTVLVRSSTQIISYVQLQIIKVGSMANAATLKGSIRLEKSGIQMARELFGVRIILSSSKMLKLPGWTGKP